MRRRRSALMLAAVLAAAGCGGSSAPELTDPTAIVTAALKSTDASSSVHVDATIDGEVPIAVPGLGGGGPVDLTGTTAKADLDIAGSAAHATFLVPALFGLSGELIATGGKGYLKTTLSGDQYQVVDLSTLPVDLTDGHGLIDQLGDALLSGKLTLTKGADVACGSGQCYTVTADVTGEQLAVDAARCVAADRSLDGPGHDRGHGREGGPEPPPRGPHRGDAGDRREPDGHRADLLRLGQAGHGHRAAARPGPGRVAPPLDGRLEPRRKPGPAERGTISPLTRRASGRQPVAVIVPSR